MSALAEIADRLHFSLVCKRAARQVQRRLAATPPAMAGRSRGRALQLRGKVADPQWVVAPLTGSRVVGYRLLVETVGRYWMNRRVLVDHCEVADFLLHDEAGEHFVCGEYGRLIAADACHHGRRVGGSAAEPKAFPDAVVAVLADRAQVRAEARDPRHYRWHEYHIHEGDDVFVDGVWGEVGGEEEGGTSCLRGAAERPLLVSCIDREVLLRDLAEPDESLMRVLPRMVFSTDRDA